MTTTLSQIAADVRRLAPEHFPTGMVAVQCVDGEVPTDSKTEVARLALIGAMVLATNARRCLDGWEVCGPVLDDCGVSRFHHAFFPDQNGDPLPGLYAAFLWAKGGGK